MDDDGLRDENLPALPEEHAQFLHSGMFVRESRLPPHPGPGYFRMQYVLAEKLFFAVILSSRPARIFRAVYLLVPAWGFHNQVGNRVVGYEVMNRGHPGPGPLEEWNCMPAPGVNVVFGESIDVLVGALIDPGYSVQSGGAPVPRTEGG